MVNAIRKTCELRINVLNDEIMLLGHEDESAGKMLQGTVVLNAFEPIKVKAITLRFTGKMKVSWTEGTGHQQHYYRQERTIMEHKWRLLPSDTPKKTCAMAAGEHAFQFELMLPGDLPQSLEADGGQVTYRLKALVERPAFVHNVIKKKPIRLVRCLLPSDFELIQSLEIHNTWAEKMEYDISLPSKVYARSETIPISFDIKPIASQLKVRWIQATLKEYCTYIAKDNSKTDTRIVETSRESDPAPLQGTLWNREVQLTIPAQSPRVFCDADNDMIRIRHKLKFVISLVNADGHLSELRCSVPVVIIDSYAQQPDRNTLPAYDQTWRSVPYDPAVYDALRRGSESSPAQVGMAFREPVTISGRARALSITSNAPPSAGAARVTITPTGQQQEQQPDPPSNEPERMWWQGMDLSRVPSYHTAVQHEPATLSSSLPAYDQLSISPQTRP